MGSQQVDDQLQLSGLHITTTTMMETSLMDSSPVMVTVTSISMAELNGTYNGTYNGTITTEEPPTTMSTSTWINTTATNVCN